MAVSCSPLAAQTIVLDPHLDLPKSAVAPGWAGASDATSQFDLDKARRGGLTAAAVALFVPQGRRDAASLAEAQADLSTRDGAIHAIAIANPARAGFARSPAEVRAIVASGRFAVIESMLNAWPLGDDLDAFDHWYARGVRIAGFVHAGHNQFADSSRPSLARGDPPAEHGGLSALGRAAVRRLNDLGILIDVSQLSDAAFDQVLAISRAPVIASHSDIRVLVDVPRNLTDAQLDALKRNGGVVAINAFGAYLLPPGGRKAAVGDLIDALDYAVRRIGIDHVALSSDFNHGGGVIGWMDVGETHAVTSELRRRGYTRGQIGKLWGGNVLRIWQAAIDARTRSHSAS